MRERERQRDSETVRQTERDRETVRETAVIIFTIESLEKPLHLFDLISMRMLNKIPPCGGGPVCNNSFEMF